MQFIADLHIHSKYSRAVSQSMVLEELDRKAHDKGILVMGTGDFTHPAWFKELKEKLEPAEPGLFKLKKELKRPTLHGEIPETRFMLTVEISSIYTKDGKGHRVHNLVFAPDFETVEKINTQLSWIGNLSSDGRPILGLDSRELVKIVLNSNPRAVVVPAHAWTPWFSVFGSMSGFDSLEDCFGEYAKYIFAIETGLSSDPLMSWRLSKLDNIAFISNSDSHSLERIGREANMFDTELSYDGIISAIKNGIPNSGYIRGNSRGIREMTATIEFFPEEGKYHLDGHRTCGVVMDPKETAERKGMCPKCGRGVTVGVLSRVEKLADRQELIPEQDGSLRKYNNRIPYHSLIQLDEIIAKSLGMGTAAKKVKSEYENLIKKFGPELEILLNVKKEELERARIDSRITDGVEAVRAGKVIFDPPGYDGEYGKMKFAGVVKKQPAASQSSLF
ncbi:DNA helicase UvrD [Candidatus Wolfebacteria bacterium]|nr:DNA helicase UvrD [Candidatus Wolfebacteria bacterium]